jgi:hypothetical protein
MAFVGGAVPVILPSHPRIRYPLSPEWRASWPCRHLVNYGQLPMRLEKVQSAENSTIHLRDQPGRYRSLVRSCNVTVSIEHQLLTAWGPTDCHVHILVWRSHICYLLPRCSLCRCCWDLLLNEHTRVRRLLEVNRRGKRGCLRLPEAPVLGCLLMRGRRAAERMQGRELIMYGLNIRSSSVCE